MESPTRRHPSATLGGSGGSIAVAIVWLVTAYAHVPLTAIQGAALATAASTGLLVIGRKGLKGCWHAILNGIENSDDRPDET
jgi:hypothetical protein